MLPRKRKHTGLSDSSSDSDEDSFRRVVKRPNTGGTSVGAVQIIETSPTPSRTPTEVDRPDSARDEEPSSSEEDPDFPWDAKVRAAKALRKDKRRREREAAARQGASCDTAAERKAPIEKIILDDDSDNEQDANSLEPELARFKRAMLSRVKPIELPPSDDDDDDDVEILAADDDDDDGGNDGDEKRDLAGRRAGGAETASKPARDVLKLYLQSADGNKQSVKTFAEQKFKVLIEVLCKNQKCPVELEFDGDPVEPDDTPESLGMEDGDIIDWSPA